MGTRKIWRAGRRTIWRAIWHARVWNLLPREWEIIARNEKVTAMYAKWYLKQPNLLKWAGLAAFASHRVGNCLHLYESTSWCRKIARTVRSWIRTVGSWVGYASTASKDKQSVLYEDDFELIRKTNNLVFADLGWAHQAYLDSGLAAVEVCLAGDVKYTHMLEGFRKIDLGKTRLASAPDEAANLIWEGNLLLLEHEQFTTVQGQFDRFNPDLFSRFVSWATTMDFDLKLSTDLTLSSSPCTSFYQCIEKHVPLRFQSPDIADLRQRWFWIETEVWPLWQKVEKETSRFIAAQMKILGRETLSEK